MSKKRNRDSSIIFSHTKKNRFLHLTDAQRNKKKKDRKIVKQSRRKNRG